jgi:hypothetical protein
MKEASMHTIRPMVILAAALLVVAAPGCDTLPTAVHDETAATVLFSSSGQTKVDLCHLTSSGDYTKITIADAAYDTHMAHGDIIASSSGQCPASGTPRFVVTFELDPAEVWPDLLIVLQTESGTVYEYCEALSTCAYGVPLGSTIGLFPPDTYMFIWTDPTCALNSCVMTGDLSVVVREAEEEEYDY